MILPVTLAHCDIPFDAYRRQFQPVLSFLQRLPVEAHVAVISFSDALCNPPSCVTEIDGTFLYRDPGHFSYDGSILLARRVDLVKQIVALAR